MNYKPIIVKKLQTYYDQFPNYTIGELLYAILRKPILNSNPEDSNLNWLRDVDDREFYTAIEKALNQEKNED